MDGIQQQVAAKQEILGYEERALGSMRYAWGYFYLPLIEASKDPSFSMPSKKVRLVFINLAELINFQQRCVANLRQDIETEDGSFGKTLLKIFGSEEFSDLYYTYASGYLHSVALLDKYAEEPDVKEILSRREGEGHTLQSCLIGPLKRPLRLEALISNLIKHTPPDHPDLQHLIQLQPMAKQVANAVNMICRPAEVAEDPKTYIALTVFILCSFVVIGFLWKSQHQ